MKNKKLHSIFLCITKKPIYKEEYYFYCGYLSKIDFDKRFKEDDYRKYEFLGTAIIEFPIKFPLKLDNGKILEKLL